MANGLSIQWIIGICLTATLAVVGWTVTIAQALRMKTFEKIEREHILTQANVAANNIRISVLESKFDTINTSLIKIEHMLSAHISRDNQ